VLYGRESLLEAMPPWQGGGDMILAVSFSGTTYNALPYKFEAGTPSIADAIGLGVAIDYLGKLDWSAVSAYEEELLAYATRRVSAVPGVRLIGTADRKVSVVSFVMEGVHAHDLGTILDAEGIAVRTGHHCAMPVMEFFKVPATARASLAFYNTREEIDRLAAALGRAREVFA
jgi:cysteine desulfurase/selenocysteine lyase